MAVIEIELAIAPGQALIGIRPPLDQEQITRLRHENCFDGVVAAEFEVKPSADGQEHSQVSVEVEADKIGSSTLRILGVAESMASVLSYGGQTVRIHRPKASQSLFEAQN